MEAEANIDRLTHFEAISSRVLKPVEDRLRPFNVFDVLRCSHTEIRHSNVLAWLLDPAENHGLGDSFLRKWLGDIFSQTDQMPTGRMDPSEFETSEFRKVEVFREWEHVDILLQIRLASGQNRVICIENKIHAQQRDGQLPDYRLVVTNHHPHPDRCGFIFLTKDPEEPADPAFVKTSYAHLAKGLRESFKPKRRSILPGPRLLIENYLHILENRFMESPLEKLAVDIYRKHRKALDLIFEYRPDARQDLSDLVAKLLKKNAAKLGLVPLRVSKGVVRFVPKEWWEIKENRAEDADDWCNVFCEIQTWGRFPVLVAITYSRDPVTKKTDEIAKVMDAAAMRHEFPKEAYNSTVESEWFAFYHVPAKAIRLADVESADSTDLAERIWVWARREITSQNFRKLTDVVTPLLGKQVYENALNYENRISRNSHL